MSTKPRREADRSRMIFDVSPEVQMAIKLRAVKLGVTTGEVVTLAMWEAFASDMQEAKNTIATKARNQK